MITDMLELKRVCGIEEANTTENDVLYEFQKAAEKYAENYCQRTFESDGATTVTEYYNGDGTGVLLLKNYPIISISAIYDDTDRDYTADTLISPDDYVYEEDEGIVRLDGFIFTKGINNIKVVYIAGYTAETMPDDLKRAIEKLVLADYLLHKTSLNSIVSQEGEGEDRVGKLRNEAIKILNFFKRVR